MGQMQEVVKLSNIIYSYVVILSSYSRDTYIYRLICIVGEATSERGGLRKNSGTDGTNWCD